MRYVNIGTTNRKVSQIGLGTWQFGTKGWGYGHNFDKTNAIKIVHQAIDAGINLIDTAEIYGGGESERIVGEAIKEYEREEIILSTKFFPKTIRPSGVVRALKKSLLRLNTDFVDIYLIHWPVPWLNLGRTLKNMEILVDEGFIRYCGVSNFRMKKLKSAQSKMTHHRIQVDQVNYSMVKNRVEQNLLPYTQEEKITIMAYSPLAQGWLSGKYSVGDSPKGIRRMNRIFSKRNFKRGEALLERINEIAKVHQVTMAQVALNWLIENPSVVAIPGATSISQVEANAGSADFELSKEEINLIRQTLKDFHPRRFL